MISKQKKIEFLDGFIDLWDSHNICDNPQGDQMEVLNAVYDLVVNALDLPKQCAEETLHELRASDD